MAAPEDEKEKLLDKQKKGKARMKQFRNVEFLRKPLLVYLKLIKAIKLFLVLEMGLKILPPFLKVIFLIIKSAIIPS